MVLSKLLPHLRLLIDQVIELQLTRPVVLSSGRVLGLQGSPLLHKLTHLLVETLHFLRMGLLLDWCSHRRRFRCMLLSQCPSLLLELIHTFYDPCHLLLHCISLIGMLIGVLSPARVVSFQASVMFLHLSQLLLSCSHYLPVSNATSNYQGMKICCQRLAISLASATLQARHSTTQHCSRLLQGRIRRVTYIGLHTTEQRLYLRYNRLMLAIITSLGTTFSTSTSTSAATGRAAWACCYYTLVQYFHLLQQCRLKTLLRAASRGSRSTHCSDLLKIGHYRLSLHRAARATQRSDTLNKLSSLRPYRRIYRHWGRSTSRRRYLWSLSLGSSNWLH